MTGFAEHNLTVTLLGLGGDRENGGGCGSIDVNLMYSPLIDKCTQRLGKIERLCRWGSPIYSAREVTVLLADFIMKASYRDDDDPADGDLPVKQMSKEFKTHVDLTVRCAAASERFRLTGHKCDECGKRGGSLAIAKKLGAIGTVFYNVSEL